MRCGEICTVWSNFRGSSKLNIGRTEQAQKDKIGPGVMLRMVSQSEFSRPLLVPNHRRFTKRRFLHLQRPGGNRGVSLKPGSYGGYICAKDYKHGSKGQTEQDGPYGLRCRNN